MTDIEVLNVLGIDDFRHMTKDKIVSFASLLDQMDPMVAEKALEQFPNFANTIVSLATDYKSTLDTLTKGNTELANASISVCQSIIDCLSDQVQSAQTFEEKKYYLEEMEQLSKDVAAITDNCQQRNIRIVEFGGILLLFCVGILGCVLGAKGNFTPGSFLRVR